MIIDSCTKILPALLLIIGYCELAMAQPPNRATYIQNVRIYDGFEDKLSSPSNILVRGNVIERISVDPFPIDRRGDTIIIDGRGKTVMPGMIDAHTHIMFATLPIQLLLSEDIGYVYAVATKTANEMLLHGFTSIRDLGGPALGLKKAIDQGVVVGPRIWPCGAMISQSGGHGDFRFRFEFPARFGELTFTERVGAAAIADSPDAVRARAREQLALGATQIKLMAGGGVSSNYDPLDVTQYTVAELRAAVEAAENWGTYVTVHAYTTKAVRQAIEAGVKCIDHGQLLDDETVKLMAEHGIWWSLQPFVAERSSGFAEGTPNRIKQLEVATGTDLSYRLAKKYNVRTAWGTDILFSPESFRNHNANILSMSRWYTNAEILRMITSDNAELLAMSDRRNPYPGKLGVIAEGALADLLIVNGNPLEEIEILGDPAQNLLLIMKDGKIHKNSLP